MIGLELKRPATPVIRAMQEAGVLALPAGATIIRILPSLLLEEEHAEVAVEVIARAITATR